MTIFIFSIFGVLFSIEKGDKQFSIVHIIVVALFSSSIGFGLSYFMYIRYNVELDNRIVFTITSIIGFGFEHFTVQQIIELAKILKDIKVTFKNNKK